MCKVWLRTERMKTKILYAKTEEWVCVLFDE